MSFGINGPEPTPAIQKSHHTNDGGAGNLGYFNQKKKQRDEEDNETDLFQSSNDIQDTEDDIEMLELEAISEKIKGFFSFFNKNEENNNEEE